MSAQPQLPDRAAILRLIPHQGASCLIDAVIEWDAERIVCMSESHRATDHALRHLDRLSPLVLIEYGAQAMAVHAALLALTEGRVAERRLLVSAQAVELACGDLALLRSPLHIHAQRRFTDAAGALYGFEIFSAGQRCASGRVGVLRGGREA